VEATPWVRLPEDAGTGIPSADLGELRIGPLTCHWGWRTYVMGIVNVTPDSFSGDGVLTAGGGQVGAVEAAVALARRLVAEGADVIDIGGESTRPGARPVGVQEELDRVLPIIEGLRGAPVPISKTPTRSGSAGGGRAMATSGPFIGSGSSTSSSGRSDSPSRCCSETRRCRRA